MVVSDLAMPGGQYGDGMPLLGYIGRRFPMVCIVALSMLDNPARLKRLHEVGVTAVINQSDDLSHIELALVHVMRARLYRGVGASGRRGVSRATAWACRNAASSVTWCCRNRRSK